MMKIRIVRIPNKFHKYRVEVFNLHSIVYSITLYGYTNTEYHVIIIHRKYVYKK